jgi:hypothetical protein
MYMQIRNFVNDIQTELDKPGVNSFGLGDFKAPKVLGDILESIAGALFLDTCLEVDEVWKVRINFVCCSLHFNHKYLVSLFLRNT